MTALKAALERIVSLALSLEREPVQSRSIERRYGAQILDTARDALKVETASREQFERFLLEAVPLGCERNPVLSRVCQRGTRCCGVNHATQSDERDIIGRALVYYVDTSETPWVRNNDHLKAARTFLERFKVAGTSAVQSSPPNLEPLFTVTAEKDGPPYYVTLIDGPRKELMSVYADDEFASAVSWREQILDALQSALDGSRDFSSVPLGVNPASVDGQH